LKIINVSFLLGLGAFAIGGLIFKSTAPTRCATILPGDSVFVLTGDDRRIPFARRVTRNVPKTTLYVIGAGAPAIATRPRVRVESDSKSTYQNAIAIRDIATEHGLDRVVLVTTVDHFNRAKYLLGNELPNTEIVDCPVTLTGMPASKQLQRWAIEYVKYIGTLLGWKES
jgi:uncharacterized SAM-binding protein YcdF (DUF218 family)